MKPNPITNLLKFYLPLSPLILIISASCYASDAEERSYSELIINSKINREYRESVTTIWSRGADCEKEGNGELVLNFRQINSEESYKTKFETNKINHFRYTFNDRTNNRSLGDFCSFVFAFKSIQDHDYMINFEADSARCRFSIFEVQRNSGDSIRSPVPTLPITDKCNEWRLR